MENLLDSLGENLKKGKELLSKTLEGEVINVKLKSSFWDKYGNILAKFSAAPSGAEVKELWEVFLIQYFAKGYTRTGKEYLELHETFKNSLVVKYPSEYYNWLTSYSFIDLYSKNLPEQKPIIIDESKRIQKILFDIYKNYISLLDLNSREFEEAIAEILFKQGYKVELTQRTKDNGYDILALLDVKGQLPIKYLVECKRYTREKVGVEIIRSFKEVIDTEKANRGMIVTTSYFTKGALDKQSEIPYLLDYRDKDNVIEWVKEYFNNKVD